MSLRQRRSAGLGVALLVAACQSTPQPTGPAASPAASGAVSGASSPAATAAGSPAPASSFVAGDGDLFLDPIDGLDGLSSHRATLTWSFEGTVDGQAATWSEESTLSVGTEPATAELMVTRTNVPGLPTRSWLSLVNGVLFSTVDGEACSATLPNPDRNAFLEPALQLSALIGGTQTGTETIDGTDAEVFVFDGKAMGLLEPTTATGRVWVSPSDELLLKYEVAVSGGEDYFGAGVSGTLTGAYSLTRLGGTADVSVPDDCPAGLVDGPQPTDATDIVAVPGMTRLHTVMTVKKVAAFYHDTSLAFGWKPVGDPSIQEDPDVAGLSFTADGLAIKVLITAEDGGASVEITAIRK